MRILYTLALYSLLLPACFSSEAENICDQRAGNEYIQASNKEAAFKVLQGCEYDKNVSGRTLAQLSLLYGYFGYGVFSSDELRAKKVFALTVRAAKLGDRDSVESLADIYKTGEKMVPVSPNTSAAECLHKLADSSSTGTAVDVRISEKVVSECLSRR